MADKAHRQTDRRLKKMERHLSAIYHRANHEVGEKWKSYLEESGKKIDSLQLAYEEAKKIGDEKEIAAATERLAHAKRTRTLQDKRFQRLTNQLAAELTNVNRTAVAYINGELPDVYALNYNALAPVVGKIKGYSFEMVDAETIRNLAEHTKDQTLLPYRKIDGRKDVRWNTKLVNSEVMQGIIQGESMGKIAGRLGNVLAMDEHSAIRNARTSVTSAENKGRQDSYEKAEEDGVILMKEWQSSDQPGRTRDWHMPYAFDSLVVGIHEQFHNEVGYIDYPGDPSADPANTYNCRCTMVADVQGFHKVR